MKFDFKITTWERVEVPTHLEDLVCDAIKKGVVDSSNSLHDFLSENGHDVDTEYSIIQEVEEQMSVEENGGSSTIEVLGDDGNNIWQNGE